MTEESVISNHGGTAWTLFVFCFISGLIMQLMGLTSVSRDYGGSYLWWTTSLSNPLWMPILIYHILTPICFIALSIHLVTLRKQRDAFSITASLCSVATGILWIIFQSIYRSAENIVGVALSIFYWSGSIVLFGITFFFVGVLYLRSQSINLTRLTGLSFVIVGIIAVVVGYIGGFTFLPWFTVYDFPWVTSAAILPCALAILHLLEKEKSNQNEIDEES